MRATPLLEILTQNAVRAMKETISPKLVVHTKVSGKAVVVSISNTGKAIPREVQINLFKQRITKAQGAQGTGIGLVIARTIVESYSGKIELAESSDVRTTFEFTLPLRPTVPVERGLEK